MTNQLTATATTIDEHNSRPATGAFAPITTLITTPVLLDTSVLVNDPDAMFAYPNSTIIVSLTVVEELDDLKVRSDDVGRAARAAARNIEQIRIKAGGHLQGDTDLGDGAVLRIATESNTSVLAALGLDPSKADNKILAAAITAGGENGNCQLVSADTALRLKAAALGLSAAEHRRTGVQRNKTATGWHRLEVLTEAVDWLYDEGSIAMVEIGLSPEVVAENEFVVVRSGTASALTRRHGDELMLLDSDQEAWGLRPRSKEQRFALDLLLDPNIPVVSITGQAGTGKTILALAAALEQVFENGSRYGQYDRLMILRPIIAVGRQELGFLPGTVEDKLGPWMEAIVDAMVALGTKTNHAQCRAQLDQWVQSGRLTMEAVTYLRGRSIQNTYMLLDEVQNLEPLTIKTALTRLGEGSKAVLLGDTSQIDSPFLSEQSNALSVTHELLVGSPLFGQITLTKGERSPVAEMVAARM